MSGHDTRRPDDAELRALMASYQRGDLAAFEEIYTRVAPRVRAALARHGLTGAALEDLVQETFLQIHRARHTYDPAYPLMPWAAAIARHVALMHRRTTSRRPLAVTEIDETHLPVAAEAEGLADRDAVRAALAALPEGRRRPLIWHHVLGLSFREIGRRLGIGEDAAKLRSSRGMATLRARLAATLPMRRDDD